MSQSLLGPYATSSALSAEHYKLVDAVESAPDAEALNRVLVDACRRISESWARSAASPTKASHDLTLLVYCRKQRRDARLAPEDASLLKGEWALPTAVLLAGGGRLRERQIGYRACAELFPSTKHRLKLLLINTISQDLSVSPGAHNAEERWSMALHAIASPNIVSSELLSAVLEQVFDLLTAHTGAESIKPLALAALLSLVRNAVNEQFDAASSLLAATRARILALLLTSRHRHSQPSPPSVALLAALSSVIAPSSPVHPILPSAKERLQLHVQLLGRILDQLTSDHASDSSRKGVWAMERALRNIGLELGRLDETEADAVGGLQRLVWRAVHILLRTDTALADGALVSALRLVPLLPEPVPIPSTTCADLLSRIRVRLVRRDSPAKVLFALQSLALLPPSKWATQSPEVPESRQSAWDEQEWVAIIESLDSPDSTIRLAGLALIRRVDRNLVELQYERLLSSFASDETHASVTTVGGGRSRKKRREWSKQRDEVVERLLEILPYLPDVATRSADPPLYLARPRLPPAPRLLSLSLRPGFDIAPTFVLPVLSFFREAPPAQQLDFAQQLIFNANERWKKNLVAGLCLAGTAHVLRDEEAEQAAKLALDWLTPPSADPAVVELLQEPFLFLILRLIALNPSRTFSQVHSAISRIELSDALPATQYLVTKVLRDPAARHALTDAGTATANQSLADFSSRIVPPSATNPSQDAYSPVSSPPPALHHQSRLFHPPSAASTSSSMPSSPLSTDPISSPRAPRSARALERERADLLRERADRGGRGSASGMVESLMKRVSLTFEQDERGEAGGGGSGSSENVLGLQSLSSGGDVAAGERTAERDEGDTSGEPPSDLLSEREELDPFRRV